MLGLLFALKCAVLVNRGKEQLKGRGNNGSTSSVNH